MSDCIWGLGFSSSCIHKLQEGTKEISARVDFIMDRTETQPASAAAVRNPIKSEPDYSSQRPDNKYDKYDMYGDSRGTASA